MSRAQNLLNPRGRHTDFSLAPIYLLSNSGPLTLMKFNPHSLATADANNVLPQPGYPYNRRLGKTHVGISSSWVYGRRIYGCMDMQTYPERSLSGHFAKIAPYFVGHSSVSRNTFRVSCNPKRLRNQHGHYTRMNRWVPPMSDHNTSDFCNFTSLSERGVKST